MIASSFAGECPEYLTKEVHANQIYDEERSVSFPSNAEPEKIPEAISRAWICRSV